MKLLNGFSKEEVLPEIVDDKSLLPETTETTAAPRKMTDKNSLYIFAALLLIALPLILYTVFNSDINRLNGYDDCGNVCGQKNRKDVRFSCSGMDYTDKPYYKFSKCDVIPPERELDFIRNIHKQFSNFAHPLVMAFFVPFGLTLLLAAGFRYAPFFTVVSILLTSWGYLVVATLAFYYLWEFEYLSVMIEVPMILTALTVIMLCVMIYARDTITRTIMIFKESSKAISNIKVPVVDLVLTLLNAIALVALSTITHLHMNTAGTLQNTEYVGSIQNTRIGYAQNGFMAAAIILNVVLTVWAVQAMLELQNMTISSGVSKWYSSRGPVTTSYWATLKNHMGSVLLGSIVTTCVSVPRSIFILLSQISIFKNMADWFLRFLNGYHYSYIITASQGSSFLKSSEKAKQLLNLNVAETVGVKFMGSFVIFLCQILVALVSIVVYFGALDGMYTYYYPYNYNYILLAIYFLIVISLLCCYTLLGPIQVAFDTLFMCACDDILKEGHQHHSMTIEEFHSNAAEVLEKKVKGTSQPTTTPSDAVV